MCSNRYSAGRWVEVDNQINWNHPDIGRFNTRGKAASSQNNYQVGENT